MALQANKSVGYKTAAKFLIGGMFGFYLLGYSPWLSIGLGAIAGLTSGFIAAWWNATEDYMTDQPTQTQTATPTETKAIAPTRSSTRPVRYGFGVRSTRSTRTRPGMQSFGWPFRGKR